MALAAALALASASPAVADRGGRDDDHDRARHAVEQVEMKPLAEILAGLRSTVPGEVVGVEIEQEHGVWIYEIRVIEPSGRLRKVHVDGATGRVLENKSGKGDD